MDQIRMYLAHRHQWPRFTFRRSACGGEKSFAIAFHVGALIVFGKAKVERASAIDGAQAAGACAEAVDEPRDLFQIGGLQQVYIARAGGLGRFGGSWHPRFSGRFRWLCDSWHASILNGF